ncbi:hypothetical protein NPIL_483071, partial [Nephila pilipes]
VVNAVQTRSQTEAKKKGNDSSKIKVMERGDDAIIISPENNDQISIPALQKDIPELALMKIKRQDFIKAQKDHGDLKTLYEQVLSQTTALNKSYSLVDELLVKNREDKLDGRLGQRFAIMEEKIIISNILRNYTLESLDHRDKIPPAAELILRSPRPIRIRIRPRQRLHS